jgi:hypothetical protein
MFDDLRQQADDSAFEEEEEPQDSYTLVEKKPRSERSFLGMTPPQRFVIAVMLLMMTCVLSAFCLLVTEKIYIPGL